MALQSNFYWTISYMKSKILLKSRYFYNIHGSYGSCFTSSQTRSCHGYISCQPVGVNSFLDYKIGFRRGFKNCRKISKKHQIYAEMEFANALDVINDLGLDTMTFFAVTVTVVPVFKQAKASPILGFFFAGIILNQFGLIRNITDIKALSEWGILFLLFEMGLELSLARLKALAKFAFGMGLSQVILCTLAFTAFELPPNAAFGTKVLEFLFHSRPDLVNIRSVDEAVVIGAALSLSSSAFVLQLLADKGELPTRFGSATLGILLLQDIAVVPLLVILPILEGQNLGEGSMWPMLASESLKALGGLGLLSLGGKFLLRRIFEMVADSRSSEAFVALCLLTVTSTSLMTQKLGFSDTLGAFLAGALLAETNYRTQIEADIRPFRGLLLGLFFVTTGTSIDIELLLREWPNVLTLLGGLIAIKTLIIAVIGPRVGLSLQESLRIGFLLSQGGEFAFVVFSLANRLGVLPLELNRLLIIVVVLSMALTPLLNEVGRKAAGIIDSKFDASDKIEEPRNFNVSEPVVILGFSQMGQVLANFLSTPLVASLDGDLAGIPYVAFDLDPTVVKTARDMGFPVLYGDGSRLAVLQSAGISRPKAVMVMRMGKDRSVQAVERIRIAFPSVPIYARAEDLEHLLKLKKAGVTDVILENAETSLQLGAKLLRGLGVMSDDVSFLSNLMRESMEIQAEEALAQKDSSETEIMKPVQVKMSDSLALKMGERQEKGMGDLEYLKLQATKQTDSMEDQTESLDLNSSVRSQKSPSISDKLLHLTSNTDSNNDGKTEIIVQNGHDSTASEQKTFTMNISDQLLPVSSEDAEDSTTISDQRDVKLCNSSDDSVLPSEQGEEKGDIYLDQNTKCISPSD